MTKGEPVAAPDHLALGLLVERVSHALERLRLVSSPPPSLAREASELLELFSTELQRHFSWEESDQGFFAETVARTPTLNGPLRALRSEHRAMTRAMKSLLETARWAGVSSVVWREVAESFDDLVMELRRHETTEDSLVAEALTHDEGGGA